MPGLQGIGVTSDAASQNHRRGMPAASPEILDKSKQRRRESESLKNLFFDCAMGTGPKSSAFIYHEERSIVKPLLPRGTDRPEADAYCHFH